MDYAKLHYFFEAEQTIPSVTVQRPLLQLPREHLSWFSALGLNICDRLVKTSILLFCSILTVCVFFMGSVLAIEIK